ncbi:Electron transfer DM13 [Algoriphagus locisalis]|uniref:Electron transfer DM13 n=1 Tax=Algoriphagus locisalis TaxID=305507 RepID=A0A1I6XHG9_9BACT|nr:DM13 domain-containing protein [Algoriphagus locisalis]SFT37304.1 Electron transfer DM13 [Algoriphagus locisalis]
MKKVLILFYVAFLGLVSCSDDNDPVTIDPTRPTGTLSVARSGSFIDQNSAGSMGTASIGTDTEGKEFLQLSQDFNTALATGTVTVYLSTSSTFMADPGNGNPDLLVLGPVRMAGENFFAIPAGMNTAKYSHVLLWCGSVGIPFGNAPLL